MKLKLKKWEEMKLKVKNWEEMKPRFKCLNVLHHFQFQINSFSFQINQSILNRSQSGMRTLSQLLITSLHSFVFVIIFILWSRWALVYTVIFTWTLSQQQCLLTVLEIWTTISWERNTVNSYNEILIGWKSCSELHLKEDNRKKDTNMRGINHKNLKVSS